MAAFGQPVEEFGQTAEDFININIKENPEIVKIAIDNEQMNMIWESLYKLNSGGFGTAKVNYTREYVVKKINIGGQIEQKGPLYAINNIRNEVLIYHYISQKCDGVCNFIGCYYNEEDKLLYVQSKYCGLNFHKILFKPSFDHHKKREIFGKIIDNLKCLHDNGVVHRDIKPNNITISNDNTVTFIDFGLSYFRDDAAVPEVLKMNQDRNINGTPLYHEPTIPITNDEDLTKTDIYSMGVLFAIMFSEKKYLDVLMNRDFKDEPFMYRVETMPIETQTEFWTAFNENVKQILGSEINHTHFFGGFDIRLTSADLQYAFQQKNQLDNQHSTQLDNQHSTQLDNQHLALLDYQRSIKHNVTRWQSRTVSRKANKTQRILTKIESRNKQSKGLTGQKTIRIKQSKSLTGQRTRHIKQRTRRRSSMWWEK